MSISENMTDQEVRRLSWRCRRGLLELDIVLQRFSEHHLAGLSAQDLLVFDSLLDLPDNEFLDLVTSRIKFTQLKVLMTKNLNEAAMDSVLSKLNSQNEVIS